ncbi:hypothetical protein [Pontibacter sp. SGAir0037]|uniref:hypothetical protein n=1 Tax=Pontibacter sp. SGAir0037 TaxID=2571030 RepID=UPI0010CD1E8E|nr:hypothetical protein [Pontibacter sp. SGAir0037]QCR24387.1 hypothetical protein C1N53_19835 [Pontibacter sp. SGAir0037]
MTEDNNKNKERLQKQSERQATGLIENKRQQEGYTDKLAVDPSKRSVQASDSKVQNPMRNLAKGGNNTNIKHKSGGS